MGFPAIDKNSEIFGVLVDFADHEFEEVGVIGFVFLFLKDVVLSDESLLADFHQEVYQLHILLESFQQKLK